MKRLTLGKICSKRTPKLKAKAGQTRRLLPFSLALASEFRAGSEFNEYRFQSIRHLSKIYELAAKDQLTHEDLQQWRWDAAAHMSNAFKHIKEISKSEHLDLYKH